MLLSPPLNGGDHEQQTGRPWCPLKRSECSTLSFSVATTQFNAKVAAANEPMLLTMELLIDTIRWVRRRYLRTGKMRGKGQEGIHLGYTPSVEFKIKVTFVQL